jgi:hypothetical protein
MNAAEDKFAASVLACVEEINAMLPRLAARYPDLVMLTAIAEHVGGALRLFVRSETCTSEQARQIIKHMEQVAFGSAAR